MIDPTASPSRLSLTSGITVQHDHGMVYSMSFLLSLHPIRTAERLLLLLLVLQQHIISSGGTGYFGSNCLRSAIAYVCLLRL